MSSLLLILAALRTVAGAAPHKPCEFPAVQDCYQPSATLCWKPLHSKDQSTRNALKALPDKKVAASIEKLLLDGSEFKETWQVVPAEDFVYLTVQKFRAIRFLEKYQHAQTILGGKNDTTYQRAYNALTDQFDGLFYKACAKRRAFPYSPTLPQKHLRVANKKKSVEQVTQQTWDSRGRAFGLFEHAMQCEPSSHAVCCKTGKVCDCTKGADATGQCSQSSYAFCCGAAKGCDCKRPASRQFTGIIV